MTRQETRDPPGELSIGEIVGADIDGELQRRARPVPRGALGDGPIQGPAGDSPYESGLLGKRDERGRTEQSPGRMLPSQEHFRARHPACRQFDLGLVEEPQFVLFEGAPQFAEQRQLVARGDFAGVVVDRHGTLFAACLLERQIGAAQ